MKKLPLNILFALSDPLALEARPFLSVAKKAGVSEEKVLAAIKAYRKKGWIRRFGAALAHREVGYVANVLVVWKVPAKNVSKVAEMFSAFPQISHCYARRTYPQWPYNLYTMVHAKNKKECLATVKKLAEKSGLKEYQLLFSLREFKKSKSDLREVFR